MSMYRECNLYPYPFSFKFSLTTTLAEKAEQYKFQVTKARGHKYINAMAKTQMTTYSTFTHSASISCCNLHHVITQLLKAQLFEGCFPPHYNQDTFD